MADVMDLFHPAVREWFQETFGQPSPPQKEGWPLIAQGRHVLITAPTGSGKTLAAFLQCLNYLYSSGLEGEKAGVRILYISPLKALNNDIYRNLEMPLEGIRKKAEEMGIHLPSITHGVRTGDTPRKERESIRKNPPHILITTPESLFLMLTAKRVKDILKTVEYVIIDEIHSLCGEKRGVHLAVSMERLQSMVIKPFIRIGLSATLHPLGEASRFLGGGAVEEGKWEPRPVEIVDTGHKKSLLLQVAVPTKDLKVLPEGSIWPNIYSKVLELVKSHHSTLVFVNTRAVAEKLAVSLNNLAGETIARTHHGCISKESRLEVENQLKKGKLACLVATSSLELGIDVGAIDLVVQIASPKSVSRGLQRIGRAGHRLDIPSKGTIIPRTRMDLLESTIIAGEMLQGHVESTRIPRNCLDILSQQLVAMSVEREWGVQEIFDVIRCAYPYCDLKRDQLEQVLEMLTGGFQGKKDRLESPRLIWDRVNHVIRGSTYGRLLAVTNAGTIPDKGYYGVYLQDGVTRIGELDEVFVFESRLGDRFILGTSTWRIEKLEKGRVTVSPCSSPASKMPFWPGENLGRPYEFGLRFGAFLRQMEERMDGPGYMDWIQSIYPIDPTSAKNLQQYIMDQRKAASAIPTDRRIVVEYFSDEVGDRRIVIHSVFGGRVNSAMSILLEHYIRKAVSCHVEGSHNDDGILLHLMGYQDELRNIFSLIPSKEAEKILMDDLPSTPMFSMVFRYNAIRSLMMGVKKRSRSPLWIMRMRALELMEAASDFTDHPLILETFRECLEQVLDIPSFKEVLDGIERGKIQVVETHTPIPSPFTAELLFSFMGVNMYEGQMPKAERRNQLLLSNREMVRLHLGEAADMESLDPRAIAQVIKELKGSYRKKPVKNFDELHHYLMVQGDIPVSDSVDEDLKAICSGDLQEWLHALERQRRAIRIKMSGESRWIASEDYWIYAKALGARIENGYIPDSLPLSKGQDISPDEAAHRLIRRFARFHGPFKEREVQGRYPFTLATVQKLLREMEEKGIVLQGNFPFEDGENRWCHNTVFDKIRQRSLSLARKDMKPKDPEKYNQFLFQWQGIDERVQSGVDFLEEVIRKLQGVYYPVSWWEDFIFPLRMAEYRKHYLDQLCTTGRIWWVGKKEGNTRKIAWMTHEPMPSSSSYDKQEWEHPEAALVLNYLQQRGASFLFNISRAVEMDTLSCMEVLEELVWKGAVTNDSFEAVRHFGQKSGKGTRGKARMAAGAHRLEMGRWSVINDARERELDACIAGSLKRYGFITKDIWTMEGWPFPWGDTYPLLKDMELIGKVTRGYFLRKLSGAQFAAPEGVEALREMKGKEGYTALPACDPAALPAGVFFREEQGMKWMNLPGTVLVFYQGRPVLAAERYGENIQGAEEAGEELLEGAVQCLTEAYHCRRFWQDRTRMKVSFWNNQRVTFSDWLDVLYRAGFEREMQDMVLWRRVIR